MRPLTSDRGHASPTPVRRSAADAAPQGAAVPSATPRSVKKGPCYDLTVKLPWVRKAVKWTSAVLVVLVVGAWIATVWRTFGYQGGGPWVSMTAGVMFVGYDIRAVGPGPTGFRIVPSSPGEFAWWDWGWFRIVGNRGWLAVFPIWALIIPPFLVCAVASRLDRRKLPGACPKCGYDQTGLAADAVCPECGEAFAKVRR